MRKKIFSLLLVAALALSLGACSGGGNKTNGSTAGNAATETKATEAPKDEATEAPAEGDKAAEEPAAPALDTSKKVELVVYFMGDAPVGMDAVMTKLNEKLMADFNCTMKLNFTTWADYATKYNLILTSGQPIDMIYTANWLQDRDYAKKHAFKPLDELLPVYAPELQKFVGEEYWADATEEGKIYTIPATWKEYIDTGVAYRADLAEKYSLPEPNSIENLEAYLAGIKANEPKMQPTLETGSTGSSYSGFSGTDLRKLRYFDLEITDCGLIIGYSADGSSYSRRNIQTYWGTDLHKEDLAIMKRFADQGFWSRNALSQKVEDMRAAFGAGQNAAIVSGQNVSKYGSYVQDASLNHPDWKIGYISYAGNYGYANPVQPTQNGTAFPTTGENTERALAVLEKLTLDKDYYMLSHYGIEGEHYTVDGENQYVKGPKGDDFLSDGFNNWNWRNPDYMIFPESYKLINEVNKEYEGRKQIFPMGFAPNVDSVQTEIAAISQLRNQYLAPISAGLSKDIEKDLNNFMEKAKAAGLEKVQQNYLDQYAKWCDERGVQ